MKISIIGVGLIGGSIALKLKQKKVADFIYGTDQNIENLDDALNLKIINEKTDLETGIRNSDLVIIAIPVDSSRKILPQVLDLISDHQTVMDVGSTKSGIVDSVKNHPKRSRFVAFHPMWGTENNGPKSAIAESFAGKAGVICNKEDSATDALELVENVVKSLDMHLIYMNAEDHDIHTAYISHISHITSYALANTVLEKEKEEDTIFQLASSGFSSTVRLAKSHPEMWVPIFKQNKNNVLDVLNEHISQLRKFKSALEKDNFEYLEELIVNANKIRGILDK
ncbi:prephenate dehydrogenase [Chryseobacterium piscicola]|jgi:prephenate dehydrogenase|uniref:Prephenate dehydrogenase n=1 Tax=Chryseobacterium piscicola TaxID=551459 RepID=A0A1N7NKF1_9FLAO|nr:prephenate dehydrogenase [Chryseobacterium piscicola]PQA90466.1 prephenate dehydrogenase [Chryseobacterium piscicola]SIS98844.1 prephenate dehydrogenase [Chryseobacterium piscicola]